MICFFIFLEGRGRNISMKIKKVLNNNVAIVVDQYDEEIVIMGKGLVFQKKAGDTIDETMIEKSFVLDDKSVNDKLGKLVSDIPMEHLTIAEMIITHAEAALNKKLDETIYLTLTDHIHFAIVRQQQNINIANKLLWEIKKFYKEEYQIGLYAIGLIKDKLGVTLPEDEAGSIAIHIANALAHEEMPVMLDIIKVVEEILNIVKYYFIVDFDEESLPYLRFLTHIKFFAQRLVTNDIVKSSDDSLFEIMKDKCPEAYKCTEKIKKYIEKYYSYAISKEEMVYLMLHINRLVQEEKN